MDIRLTAQLPGNTTSTIRVDRDDKIIDWVKMLLSEHALTGDIADFQTLRNGSEVTISSSFAKEGFTNGDELLIKKKAVAPPKAKPIQTTSPEPLRFAPETKTNGIEDIPDVKESRVFHQLGILLLDGSESMKETGDGGISLADWVNRAVREFLGFFKSSTQVNNFSIAIITFDETATVLAPVTELGNIDDFADYNPVINDGKGTFIGAGLLEAEKLANDFLNNPSSSVPHDVRIIVMSDGLCLKAEETKLIADRIKRNPRIVLCSSLFTTPAKINEEKINMARSVLSDIASAANLYKTSYRESDLRQFFITSMSARRKYNQQP